jgi:hypothetical protein
VTETVVSVLSRDPDYTALPTPTPATIRKLLRRCLAKDRRQRLSDAADARLEAATGEIAVDALTESPNVQRPTAITPDGTRVVLFEEGRPGTGTDLMLLTLDGGARAVTPLLATPFAERNGELSPDGRWLAFESDEPGQFEIYVRPFPKVEAGKWQVSTSGGTRPLWARSGRELFYRAPDGAVLGVAVQAAGGHFRTGTPARLVEGRYVAGGAGFPGRSYDVALDGARFLMIQESDDSTETAPPVIVVVQHWVEELKRRVPTR